MKSVFVGVDLGTSVVKATALEPASGNRYQVSERYASRFEQSQPLGWSLVLERILARLVATLSSGIRVEALAITAMVPNVALINPDGETLGSLLFCDNDAYDLELDLDAELN
jgi:sugar (pentulose or hexulose) kinase